MNPDQSIKWNFISKEQVFTLIIMLLKHASSFNITARSRNSDRLAIAILLQSLKSMIKFYFYFITDHASHTHTSPSEVVTALKEVSIGRNMYENQI